ncbi:lytic transglycosylase domain-containing protein [Promicromonospora iranensis]|uniref:lytic transglycosylase domain-containing protein n=1 Tax=Promicromonospora iranensis TaxID=1105144 RepID=UPI0023A942F4|nr:lytic transglycosylase domain-containing protein [Promicromonospora iranensis]
MRARTWTAAFAAVLLLTGCGSGEGPSEVEWPQELEYPPAPQQQLPQAAPAGREPTAEVPLADLAHTGWLRNTAARTEIPRRALAAYAGAALRLAQTEPECGIGWNTLAGIGAVESIHGTYLGAQADAEGMVSPSIIGIPLDGSEGVKAIADTDDGELDEDREWDRAVGPMQFIPTTWADYAEDGNLDGEADPHQIDDAALSAAHYLCESGGDVSTDDGWTAALSAYNQSVSYAHDVADLAGSYGEQPQPS